MREQLALAIPDEFLRGQPAHTLDETAFDLAAVDPFVDRLTAVVENIDSPHVHLAGETVDFHLADRRADGEIIKRMPLPRVAVPVDLRGAVVTRRGQTHALHPRFMGDIPELEKLGRMLRMEDAAVTELDIVRAAGLATLGGKHLGRDRTQPRDDLLARVLHRHAVHVRAARGGGG